jgi:hypothetical protein
MVQLQTDAAGHVNYGTSPGGSVYGTPTLSAFSSTWGASATSITGNDTAGNIAFTGGTSPAAGTVVTVTFAQPYPAPPRAVVVQGGATDQSGGPLFTATAITAGGFTLSAAAGATKSYVVQYAVISA